MELKLIRRPSTEKCTIGELFINGEEECFTLEDVVRDTKIYGETAIPKGKYQVLITYSPRFRRYLPEIRPVKDFTGIRIHPGNTADDTLGCILVGKEIHGDSITRSREAFQELYQKISEAFYMSKELITIDIT